MAEQNTQAGVKDDAPMHEVWAELFTLREAVKAPSETGFATWQELAISLRKELALSRQASAQSAAPVDVEALIKIANDAASSLDAISSLAGRKTYGDPAIETYMETPPEIRAYAKSRAMVSRADLAALIATPPASVPAGDGGRVKAMLPGFVLALAGFITILDEEGEAEKEAILRWRAWLETQYDALPDGVDCVETIDSAILASKAESVKGDCACEACKPQATAFTPENMRMIVCAICGNKRCPHATNHKNPCSGSNEPGQKGSSWENYPKAKP